MREFSEEMDDLFFWLDEVDSLLNTGLRPADRDFLQQLSDKLKVCTSLQSCTLWWKPPPFHPHNRTPWTP